MPEQGAGSLKCCVLVQRDLGETVDGNDGVGQPRERWRTLFTTWANIEPLSGREYWQAEQVQSDTTHRIQARFRASWLGVDATCRISWSGRTFHFTEPPRVVAEDGRWVEVMAKEQS